MIFLRSWIWYTHTNSSCSHEWYVYRKMRKSVRELEELCAGDLGDWRLPIRPAYMCVYVKLYAGVWVRCGDWERELDWLAKRSCQIVGVNSYFPHSNQCKMSSVWVQLTSVHEGRGASKLLRLPRPVYPHMEFHCQSVLIQGAHAPRTDQLPSQFLPQIFLKTEHGSYMLYTGKKYHG